jgi:hypothetical protein
MTTFTLSNRVPFIALPQQLLMFGKALAKPHHNISHAQHAGSHEAHRCPADLKIISGGGYTGFACHSAFRNFCSWLKYGLSNSGRMCCSQLGSISRLLSCGRLSAAFAAATAACAASRFL